MDVLELLKDFVSGNISPEELVAALETGAPEILELLVPARPPMHARSASSYEFLLDLDPKNPYSVSSARAHAAELLATKGHAVERDHSDEPLLRTMSRLEPRWVNVPPATMKEIIEAAGDRTGKELREFTAKAITERFRCLGKKPAWMQSPDWQYTERGEPMVFVGQMKIPGLYHDDSTVYVFADPVVQTVKSVIQSA